MPRDNYECTSRGGQVPAGAAAVDEATWVFDSLVGFLHGPIWSAPLLTFIEDKSLIFEPETEDSKEYREIHSEYKNLVDLLLGCYMEDMGISPEQFERACTMNTSSRLGIQFQQSLFEQIWAANEFEVFKRMMMQKNLELQLQALKMIEQKYGLTPASLVSDEANFGDDEMPIEELLRTDSSPSETPTESIAESPPELSIDKAEEAVRQEHERLAAEYRNESVLLIEALKNTTSVAADVKACVDEQQIEPEEEFVPIDDDDDDDDEGAKKQEEAAAAEVANGDSEVDQTCDSSVSAKEEKSKIQPKEKAVKLTEAEIRKRQVYLKAQRDKLVALKKQARSQKLGSATTGVDAQATKKGNARPSSARLVAEAAIDGNKPAAAARDFKLKQLDSSALQVRKALAARLKAEVVQK